VESFRPCCSLLAGAASYTAKMVRANAGYRYVEQAWSNAFHFGLTRLFTGHVEIASSGTSKSGAPDSPDSRKLLTRLEF
jgi:hypothetical protein